MSPAEPDASQSFDLEHPWQSVLPEPSGRRLRVAACLVSVFALWSLVGRYWGIQHDAMAYALEAVARINPDPLAGDIFLRYRSQDEFTVFPVVFAAFIRWFGIDQAASLLTFVCIALWYWVAWRVARRLVGPTLSLLSIGLLLAIPGWYSAGSVFRYAEPFMTARLPAEALCLGALLAVLNSRRVLAAALLGIAFAVHPLMALPGAILVTAVALPLRRPPDWALLTCVVVFGATVGGVLLSWPAPLMTGDWLQVTRWRSGFLFVGDWAPHDREVAAQTIGTLALAAVAMSASLARKLAVAALCTAVAGLTLAVIASEVAPLKLLLQGQPWRWLWVGRFAATLLLPALVYVTWRAGPIGRSVATLVCCVWLLTDLGSTGDIEPVGVGGLLALLALGLWAARDHVSSRISLILAALCAVVFVVVCAALFATAAIEFGNRFLFGSEPAWVQRVVAIADRPGISALLLAVTWAAAFLLPGRAVVIAFMSAWLVVLAGSLPETVRRWTDLPFGATQRDKFQSWRAIIPPNAEVLWYESPQAAWFLLDRRSFLTVSQAAGTVFSADTTREVMRRAAALAPLVAPGTWVLDPATRGEKVKPFTVPVLRAICGEETLGFVVTSNDLGMSAAMAEWPGRGDFVYLYDCARLRHGDRQ